LKDLLKNNLFVKLAFLALLFVRFNTVNADPTVNQHSLSFSDVNTVTLVGADGLIMKSVDGGLTWQEQTSGTSEVLYANEQMGTDNGIAVGANGTILVTVDGGTTWSLKTSGTTETLKDVQILNSNVIIVSGSNGTVLRTDDAGETWTVIASGTTENLNDVQFIDQDNGFIVGDNGTFLTTNDQGATWNTVNTKLGLRLNAVYMMDANEGTAVGELGLIVRTTDGGNTWTVTNTQGFQDDFNDVKFFTPSIGVAAGNHGLMARTEDGGNSWYGIYGNIDADLYCINPSSTEDGMGVGQDGIEVYTRNSALAWFSSVSTAFFVDLTNITMHGNIGNPKALNPGITPEQFSLNQNYPNPFNPSTRISYNLPVDAKVTLQIFDMTGREVNSLVNGLQTAGNYTVTVDAKGMSSGVYFYRISADAGNQQFAKTMKMILTK
jgi:photosystem II stability/assembly factor-like uncharacterized protein